MPVGREGLSSEGDEKPAGAKAQRGQQGGWTGMRLRMSRRAGAEVLPQHAGQTTFLPPPSASAAPGAPQTLPAAPGDVLAAQGEREPKFLWVLGHYLCLRLFSRSLDPTLPFLPFLGSTLLAAGEGGGEGGIQRVGPLLKLNPHLCARPCSPPGSGAPRTCPWAMAGLCPWGSGTTASQLLP